MTTSDVRSRWKARIGLSASAAFLFSLAHAQQVPPGATTGGALPRLEQPAEKPEPQGELFNIPRVSERPLALDEGPRVVVKAFRLAGAVDRPAANLKVAEAQAVLDAAVQSQPAEGYSINQLQAVADKVTELYRSKGLILAQAFIPAQDVHNGEVLVQVLEGKLGGITIEGNKSYSSATLLQPFHSLVGAPVEKNSIESALLTLINYPGLTAVGVLGAGEDVGTTNLVVRVQNEDRFEFGASLDNHGSQFAGENRALFSFGVNNPLGRGDRLRIYGLYGFDTSDSRANGLYGGFSYDVPVWGPRNSLHVSYAHNAYEVGNIDSQDIVALDSEGTTDIIELGVRHNFVPSRLGSSSIGLTAASKTAVFEQAGVDAFEDKLTTLTLDFAWDRIDTRFRGVNQIAFAYTRGFDGLFDALEDYDPNARPPASRLNATGAFDKFTLSLRRLQRITPGISLLLRAEGQTSSDILVSLEQFSLGGPNSVRAYPVAELLADEGVLGSAELIFGAPGFASRPAFGNRTWGQVLQFSLFYDYANGKLNQVLSSNDDDSVNLSGWGGAVQLNIPGRYFFRADVATPISDLEPTNGRDPQYYVRFGVTF